MNINKIVIGVLVATTLLFGFLSFSKPTSTFGGLNTTGPTQFQPWAFLQGLAGGSRNQFSVDNSGILSTGGAVLATTSSTGTLTAANLINHGTISFTPAISGATLTLPTQASLASASQFFIPNSGDQTIRYIVNSTTNASALTTIAGNTGMILQLASTTNVAGGGVNSMVGPGTARLTFRRSATTTDIYVLLEMFR